MEVKFRTQPAPTPDPQVLKALQEMTPRVFMLWNPYYRESQEGQWDGRWEIWIELTDVSHPDAKHQLAPDVDMWNTDAQCWMRKLQTYKNEDGSFAPVDHRLIVGLEMADTWANRHFYDEHVEQPELARELAEEKQKRDIYSGASNYYNNYTKTSVGRHANSGWRWRIS